MNNAVTTTQPRRSITIDMAGRYGMEADAFEQTLRATCFPPTGTREEFAAFLLVAKEYKLNPMTKEIYAFPKRGGGIVPVVSIDGWMNLINSHPAFDGMDFDEVHSEAGEIVSIKCTIYRKDRSHPVSVTEYLSECIRPTDPWKMKHRMLRHKSAIQCARYAFGFAGIYDEDEAEKIAQAKPIDIIPPSPPPAPAVDHVHEPETANPIDEAKAFIEKVKTKFPGALPKTSDIDFGVLKMKLGTAVDAAKDGDALQSAWEEIAEPYFDRLTPDEQEVLMGVHRAREREIEP